MDEDFEPPEVAYSEERPLTSNLPDDVTTPMGQVDADQDHDCSVRADPDRGYDRRNLFLNTDRKGLAHGQNRGVLDGVPG